MTTTTRRGKTFEEMVREAKANIQEVTQEEFKQWLAEKRDVKILDIREPHDHAVNRIPGALNIPRGMLEVEIDESVPDQDKPIVLYCGGGSRSALAAQTLQEMGYGNVYSLQGGFKHWVQ